MLIVNLLIVISWLDKVLEAGLLEGAPAALLQVPVVDQILTRFALAGRPVVVGDEGIAEGAVGFAQRAVLFAVEHVYGSQSQLPYQCIHIAVVYDANCSVTL